MVSTNERRRFARMFDQQVAALERQKQALTRMTLMLTEASAALFEIAGSEDGDWIGARQRAQGALDRMEVIRAAAATNDDGEESKS